MGDNDYKTVNISTTNNTAIVDVQSGWYSKINWTQAVGTTAMVLTLVTGGKFNITPDQQTAIVVVIGVVTGAITFVLRTWFNPTVPPSAVAKAS